MKGNLERLQAFSLGTRAILLGLSLAQGMIVLRLLGPEQYGLLGIVLAVAGTLGVYQQAGLGVGTTKVASVARNVTEASYVFFTSLFVRMLVSLPAAMALFLAAAFVAQNIYHQPEMTYGLRLYALIMILSGVLEIPDSALNGAQRFKLLFGLRITTGVVGIICLATFISIWELPGYFLAQLATTTLAILLFVTTLFWTWHWQISIPSWTRIKQTSRSIFGLSVYVYVAQILESLTNSAGILIAGLFVGPTQISYFKFSLVFGRYILQFSDAVNTINLPVRSKLFAEGPERFKAGFQANFTRLLAILVLGVTALLCFAREGILILGGMEYLPAYPLIVFIVFAFAFRAVFELLTGAVLLPSDDKKGYLMFFVIAALASLAGTWALVVSGGGVLGASIALVLACLLGLLLVLFRIYSRLGIVCIWGRESLLLSLTAPSIVAYLLRLPTASRVFIFACQAILLAGAVQWLGVVDLAALFAAVKRKVGASHLT